MERTFERKGQGKEEKPAFLCSQGRICDVTEDNGGQEGGKDDGEKGRKEGGNKKERKEGRRERGRERKSSFILFFI